MHCVPSFTTVTIEKTFTECTIFFKYEYIHKYALLKKRIYVSGTKIEDKQVFSKCLKQVSRAAFCLLQKFLSMFLMSSILQKKAYFLYLMGIEFPCYSSSE